MSESARVVNRLVVKVGASVLTDGQGRLNAARLRAVVEQLAACLQADRQLIVVSSGAVACGMGRLSLKRRPKELDQLQACAAIGQGELMHRYSEAFAAHGVTVAQVLLTEADLSEELRYRNAKKTLQALMVRRVVPIVNENDVVAVQEMAFGDNDRLSALVACAVGAQLLVILTDVDGVLQDGRVIERIDQLNHHHHALALGASRETTLGGMASKLAAARITGHSGIPLVIANGTKPGVLAEILEGKPVGTLIVPSKARLKYRKWRLAFSIRQPKGAVVADAGAVEAVVQRGKSLLPSGIQDVRGRFHAGEAIAVLDHTGQEVARGLSNFSSSDLTRIRGLRTDRIAGVLGHKTFDEVVHRDNIVLTQEVEG